MNKTLIYTITAISVVIIIVIYIIKKREKFRNKNLLLFTEKPFQAIKKKIISGREIYNSTEGYELSVFTWLYIDNIIENYGTKKNILIKGNASKLNQDGWSSNIQCPGIWLSDNDNSIIIKITSKSPLNEVKQEPYIKEINYSSTTMASASVAIEANLPAFEIEQNPKVKEFNEYEGESGFKIDDFPVKRWFSIAITIKGKAVDLYYNGKLIHSKILGDLPNINNGDLTICSNDGFSGAISNLGLYSFCLTSSEIETKHDKGYIPNPFYRLLNSLEKSYKGDPLKKYNEITENSLLNIKNRLLTGGDIKKDKSNKYSTNLKILLYILKAFEFQNSEINLLKTINKNIDNLTKNESNDNIVEKKLKKMLSDNIVSKILIDFDSEFNRNSGRSKNLSKLDNIMKEEYFTLQLNSLVNEFYKYIMDNPNTTFKKTEVEIDDKIANNISNVQLQLF